MGLLISANRIVVFLGGITFFNNLFWVYKQMILLCHQRITLLKLTSVLMFNYQEFTKRNEGYINIELQQKIKGTRLLIAGCGIGSTIAEEAIRIGFKNFP